MKKFTFLCFTLLLTTLLVAQNQVLFDFESNETENWNGSGPNTVTAIPNPKPTGNISNYVIEYKSTIDWAWGMTKWDESSLLNQDHIKLILDIYAVDASGTFKLQMDNSISSGADYEGYKDITANNWQTIEFDISGSSLDYKQIAFQAGFTATIYIDNIKIVEGIPTDNVLATFETNLDGWSTWGANALKVDNPNTTGNNTSSGVALFDQTTSGAWNGFAKWFGTPAILNPDKYVKLSVDVYYPSETQRFQLNLLNSVSSAPNHIAFNDDVPVGEWTTLEFDLTELPADDYQQIAFQSGLADSLYIDNIVLKIEETTPPPPPPPFVRPNAWINEIHYDKIAIEESEFVEIVIESPEKYTMSDFDIYFYDGDNGTAYRTANMDDFNAGNTDSTFHLYTLSYPAGEDWIYNENAGMALTYKDHVLQFISYDGSFVATDGPAKDNTSEDIGVSQKDSPQNGYSLQLIGLGNYYTYFTWVDPPASPGETNTSQIFATPIAVPFNWTYLFFIFCVIGLRLVYIKLR